MWIMQINSYLNFLFRDRKPTFAERTNFTLGSAKFNSAHILLLFLVNFFTLPKQYLIKNGHPVSNYVTLAFLWITYSPMEK